MTESKANLQIGAVTASIVEWKYSEIDNTKIIYLIEVVKREGSKW